MSSNILGWNKGAAKPDDGDDEKESVKEWLEVTFTQKRRKTLLAGSMGLKGANQGLKSSKLKAKLGAVAAISEQTTLFEEKDADWFNIPDHISPFLKDLDDWNYDILKFEAKMKGDVLKYVGMHLFNKINAFQKFKIPHEVALKYFHEITLSYNEKDNVYHNSVHGADVGQTLYCLMHKNGLHAWLSPLEVLSAIFAALVHDVNHTGTTNDFLIKTRSEMALLYNDRSVLENHHVSTAFRILRKPGCDILAHIEGEDYSMFRTLAVSMVLHTDMSLHAKTLKKVNRNVGQGQDGEEMPTCDVLGLLLHCADISHPGKSWETHVEWNKRITEEFFSQGDTELKMGLEVSPMCDRKKNAPVILAKGNLGFIQFVVIPSFKLATTILRELKARHGLYSAKVCGGSGSSDRIYNPWKGHLKDNIERYQGIIEANS